MNQKEKTVTKSVEVTINCEHARMALSMYYNVDKDKFDSLSDEEITEAVISTVLIPYGLLEINGKKAEKLKIN